MDTLYGGKTVLRFSTPRRKGEVHGTGCVLSSAIAVFIARGLPVEKAVEKAKQFVDSMLKNAEQVGSGGTKYFQFWGDALMVGATRRLKISGSPEPLILPGEVQRNVVSRSQIYVRLAEGM